MIHPRHRTLWSCLIVASILIATPAAHASYTVIDDDLLPTPMQKMAPPAHYTILFAKYHSPLLRDSREMLLNLLPQMQNAQAIKIIGRPDARSYMVGKLAQLARNRADHIRDFLTRQGIPINIISIVIDNSPNPQRNGSLYPCDLYISSQAPSVDSQKTAMPEDSSYYRALDMTVKYISRASEIGRMNPNSALKLIHILTDANFVPPQNALISPVQDQAPVNEEWTLYPSKSLQENLTSWAKSKNYTLIWHARDYKVNRQSTIQGDFLNSLSKIITAAQLSMELRPSVHEIYINDIK